MASFEEDHINILPTHRSERNVTFSIENEEHSFDSTNTAATNSSITRVSTRSGGGGGDSKSRSTFILFSIKIIFGLIFFMIVLVSSVLSKLSLVSLSDSLRHYTWEVQKKGGTAMKKEAKVIVVALYWQLLLILMVPNCLTFLRCFFFGFLGKTVKSFPWPTGKAMLLGLLSSLVEVIAMSTLVFLVLTELSPGIAILSLNGIFLAQLAIDAYSAFKAKSCAEDCDIDSIRRHSIRTGYRQVGNNDNPEQQSLVNHDDGTGGGTKFLQHMQCVLEHYTLKGVAFLLQGAGVIGLAIFWGARMHSGEASTSVYLRPVIGLPFILVFLSVIWCNRFQEAIAKSNVRKSDKVVSARYKSSLMNSGVRIILYPIVTYIIFRFMTPFHGQEVDPWCVRGPCFQSFSGDTLNEMIIHIVSSFVGYFIVWVSCTMTLSQLSVGLPLLLSTPVAVAIYYLDVHHHFNDHLFPLFRGDEDVFEPFVYSSIVASFLWVSEVLAMGFYICTKTNIILATDNDMFLAPHYDSLFLEQHTILNRQVNKGAKRKMDGDSITTVKRRNPRMIFICSTMYRETDTEMKQMLASILRVSRHYEKQHRKDPSCCDKYESHIFFDGAISANQIENFGLQLLSLLEDTLDIKLQKGLKKRTPYGYRFSWDLGVTVRMPFTIHFKDKTLVKAKKRWSQVMYMNYVINHRIVEENLSPHDTFILTTDADIDFTANSVVVLLDMLAPNLNVAAVCARTHPKGHGLLYWYQLFDYAIGHWFQKPAEHILGSVLCSPGCFSVFRCSALKLVLETYSTEVTSALEFLMKDMGEDRWLCTLLVKEGLRLEYCAISEDHTYCPTEFDEFYKQRRRWIPSTVANLVMLVSESGIITKGNDSISILYILFQVIMIFSTAISPATVILVIAAVLQTFQIPFGFTVTFLFLLSIGYGLVCLYASPKTQLDIAKFLTFIFALIMSVVIVGLFKDLIDALLGDPNKLLIGPPNCDNFIEGGNKTAKYFDCMKGQAFAANYTNGLYHTFQMPLPISVVYLFSLAATFTIAGLFHLPSFTVSCTVSGSCRELQLLVLSRASTSGSISFAKLSVSLLHSAIFHTDC